MDCKAIKNYNFHNFLINIQRYFNIFLAYRYTYSEIETASSYFKVIKSLHLLQKKIYETTQRSYCGNAKR